MTTEHNHIFKRFDKDLEKLCGQVELMGSEVTKQIKLLNEKLTSDQTKDFDDVVENDMSINALENKANKTVMRLLARRAPMGKDLRVIIGMSRMINDLERIGDELVIMAKTLAESEELPDCQTGDDNITLTEMLAMAVNLLERALLAAHNEDLETAQEMLEKGLNHQSSYKRRLDEMIDCIKNSTTQNNFQAALQSHSLNRVCDHICNICEHTVFIISGEDINHQDEL